MALGSRLHKFLKLNKISQMQLADHLGTTQATISRWINNKAEPDISTLKRIVDILNISIYDLLYDKPPKNNNKDYCFVPIIENINKYTPLGSIKNFKHKINIPENIYTKNSFAIKNTSLNMYPTIFKDDILLINQEVQIQNGDVVAFFIDNNPDLLIRRYYKINNNTVMLKSDNFNLEPLIIDSKENTEFKIIGKLIWSSRNFK